jgi:hypothetical protein
MVLGGNFEGKRQLDTPALVEGYVQMALKHIRWECMNCIHLDQSRKKWWAVVNMVMNIQIP